MIAIGLLLAAFAILAWRDFKTALILLMGLLPTYLLRFSIGPIPFTALEGMILIAGGIWMMRMRAWRLSPITFEPWIRPALIILAAACFGVVMAPDTFAALGIWKAYFIEPILVAMMLRTTFLEREDWLKALIALGASAAVVSLAAIVQVVTGKGIPAPWDVELRATGLYDFPNALGLFVAPIVAALIFTQGKEKILAAIGIIGIVLSKTEAALVALPSAVTIVSLFSSISRRTKLTIGLGAILVPILLLVGSGAVREKLMLQDLSGQARLAQWRETSHLLTSSPRYFIFGAGLSGYPTAIKPFHDGTVFEIFQYPHNIVLNIWIELGLLGLVGFGWLGFLIIKKILSIAPDSLHPLHSHDSLIALAGLLTMTIHGLVDVPYFKNDLAVLTWFFIVMIFVQIKERPTVK